MMYVQRLRGLAWATAWACFFFNAPGKLPFGGRYGHKLGRGGIWTLDYDSVAMREAKQEKISDPRYR